MTTGPNTSLSPGAAERLVVAPDLLRIGARPLTAAADAVRAAMGGLDAAWRSAAAALGGQRAGQALGAFQPAARSWFSGCEQELSNFGGSLQQAASVYADAEAATVPSASAAK